MLATAAIASVAFALSVSAASADSVVATIPNAGAAGASGYSSQQSVLTADGTRLYVTQGATISEIDTATNTVLGTITAPSAVQSIALSPDGSRLYLTQGATDSVAVVDTTTQAIVATVAVGNNPAGIAMSPDGSRVYVANADGSGSVAASVIDAASNTVIATISNNAQPRSIAVSPDGSRVYLIHFAPSKHDISVVDAATNTVIGTIPMGAYTNRIDGVAFTPDGTLMYAANPAADTVSVIDTATNTIVATIPVGDGPSDIAFTPDGTRAYVTNNLAGTVSIIDMSTNTAVATVPVAAGPRGITITPDGGYAYVVGATDVSVIALDTFPTIVTTTLPDGTVGDEYAANIQTTGNPVPERTVSVGVLPPGLTLDPTTGDLTGTPTTPGTYPFTVTAQSTVSGIVSTVTQEYTITIAETPTVPDAPVDLAADLTGGAVDLSWTAPTSDGGSSIVGYRIERSVDGGPFGVLVDDTGSLDLAYTDVQIEGGVVYVYRVYALNSVGQSVPSNEASVTVPVVEMPTAPDAPLDLMADLNGDVVDLSWTAPTSDGGSSIVGYRIERSVDGGPFGVLVDDTGSPDLAYTDVQIEGGVVYVYRVYALNGVGQSAPSNEASVTVPAAPTTPTPTPTPTPAPGAGGGNDVDGTDKSSDGSLASTGSDLMLPGVFAGMVLLLGGGAAVLMSRRSRMTLAETKTDRMP